MKGEKYGGKKIDGVSVIKTRFFFPQISLPLLLAVTVRIIYFPYFHHQIFFTL